MQVKKSSEEHSLPTPNLELISLEVFFMKSVSKVGFRAGIIDAND
jgi:hypothetical protein